MRNKIKIFDMVICITIFLTSIGFINNNIISNIVYDNYMYIYLGSAVILLILYLNKNQFKLNKILIISLIILIAHMILAYYFNENINGGIIIAIGTIFYIVYFKEKKYDKMDYYLLILLFSIIGLYSSTQAANSARYYLFNNNYFNPNLVAQIIFISVIIINSCGTEVKMNKFIQLGLNILFLIGLYNSESRSCLIIAILYIAIIYLKPIKKYISYKNIPFLYIICVIIGLIIPFMYVWMYKDQIDLQIVFSEKNFYSGRQVIWESIIMCISDFKNLFFGVGTRYIFSINTTIANPHNIYLGIILNFGIVGFFIYYYYIFFMINKIKTQKSGIAKDLIIGFIAIMFCGCFENILLWMPINLFSCLILGMAISNNNTIEEMG